MLLWIVVAVVTAVITYVAYTLFFSYGSDLQDNSLDAFILETSREYTSILNVTDQFPRTK